MDIKRASKPMDSFRAGAFHRRMGLIFALQLLTVVLVSLMGYYNVAPIAAVICVIVITSAVAWMAARREWGPIRHLATYLSSWDKESAERGAFTPPPLKQGTDADLAALSNGLFGMASRIAKFNQRERDFTRDASHELRSPLTVIKMSTDMMADEGDLSTFGQRSLQRIRRSTRELESLVEALLILAREDDSGSSEQRFSVNDVLKIELDEARALLRGRSVELYLDETAEFSLLGSPQIFSVLCWQLIRNACQQTEQGRITVTVMPDQITVRNFADSNHPLVDRHGFELAIAQRISERFGWPLELQTLAGDEQVARIRFPENGAVRSH